MRHITEKCTGCTACALSCPTFAISGDRGERHIINERRCIDCGVCGKLCPSGAVVRDDGEADKRVKRSELPRPRIDKSACSACSLCVDVCRFDCIRVSLPQFRGDIDVFAELADEKRCVGCGACSSVCPMKAITMTERGGA